VRIPASFCGLVGIKAHFGRVPVWPKSATATLAHVGPITRTLEDAALILSVIASPDERDPLSELAPSALALAAGSDLTGLRVGWCPSFGYGHADADVLEACEAALAGLAARGASVSTLAPPFAVDPASAWNNESTAVLQPS